MKFTVIREDRMMVKDGVGLEFENPINLPDTIWAVDWNGDSGHVEYVADVPNLELTSFADYQYLVDEYNAESARQAAAAEQLIADRLAARTYADRRKEDYPEIGDQLDDLFHAGAFSDEMTATIQAVKDRYPK